MLPAAGWRVVAAACLLAAADALTVSGRFHLDAGDETHGPEYEITKFTFAVGESMAKGTVRFPATDMNMMTSPALYLFNDEVWEKYHNAPACMDKVQVAHSVIKIGVPTEEGNQHVQRSRLNYGYDKEAKNTKASLRIDGVDAVWSFEWKITHTDRSKGWFLIAADCALEQYNAKVAPMTYEVTLLNPGDNHLPADEMWMPTFYAILLVLMVGHIGYCLNLLSASYETHSKVLLIVKLLGVAYVLQFVSLLFEELHLIATVLSGRGVFAIDFLSELLEGMSCLVLSFVLICLACGWTLVEEDADAKKSMSLATMLQNPRNLVAKGAIVGNLMVVAMLGLTVYTMLLVFWNKLGDADFTKFHDSDTASGQVLLKIRLGLFAFFAVSLFVTLRKQTSRGGSPILKSFLLKLFISGSVWFVTFPLMVWLANLSPHYHRHRIVVVGTLFTQTLCLALLAHQFLAESSTYQRLSTAWESGMLPGAAGIFVGGKGGAGD